MMETNSSSEEEECVPGLEEFDEYDEPVAMNSAYCKQLSREQYEEQTENETQKALLQLMSKLNQDPYLFRSVLLKRKKEEMENAGFMSYLKVKMLNIVHGSKCKAFSVTDQEVSSKLNELINGMQKTYEYAKGAKCRRSKRIAAKKGLKENKSPARIPKAPPVPPPVPGTFKSPKRKATPLKDRNIEVDTPPSMKARKTRKRTNSQSSMSSLSSLGSLSSLHVELMSVNRLRQLRSTNNLRSPGGTPLSRYRACPGSPSSISDPMYRAFLTTMQHKFRNARSPSPAPNSFHNNSGSRNASHLSDCTFTP